MPNSAALPFLMKRNRDSYHATGMTSTREKVHGLLRLDGGELRIQWRRFRTTDRYGAAEFRTDEEVDPVQEVVVPVDAVAAVAVRQNWWEPWAGPRLILTGADLRAFEEVAGKGGLQLSHPAELSLNLRRRDRLAALEFAAELAMAVAERPLRRSTDPASLERGWAAGGAGSLATGSSPQD